jgi:hypothetical protein
VNFETYNTLREFPKFCFHICTSFYVHWPLLDLEIRELAALIAQEKSHRDEMPKIVSLLMTGVCSAREF